MSFLIKGLPTNNKNPVVVPRQMHSDDVTAEGELLVGLQLNLVPSVALNIVPLDGVEAPGLSFSYLGLHEPVVHTSENKDIHVVPSAAAKVVARFVHL